MWEIDPDAIRNDYRVASETGTIMVVRQFDTNTGRPYWNVVRNVFDGHKDANRVYARRIPSFAAADAIARVEAERA